jgi:hypothetical protein
MRHCLSHRRWHRDCCPLCSARGHRQGGQTTPRLLLYSFCIFVNSGFSGLVFMIICMMILCLFCRLSYSLQHADCAGAVFYSVMKSALVAAQSTNGKGFLWVLCCIDEFKFGFLWLRAWRSGHWTLENGSGLLWGSPNGQKKVSVSVDLVII